MLTEKERKRETVTMRTEAERLSVTLSAAAAESNLASQRDLRV